LELCTEITTSGVQEDLFTSKKACGITLSALQFKHFDLCQKFGTRQRAYWGSGSGFAFDLYALAEKLKERGLQTPMLFRFPDVAVHRLQQLQVTLSTFK
jgi:arginine decarboxylase-like protein